ncbi:UNVERIFIED_CONTAM: hypothetical protein Scaly_0050900 [Sesamum calycinum]|uniref:Integrase catalytic domain-containing protein n=1 Tax=Sesamum calycinum TaxID=2727403 RepID=A0AAW2SUB3_9LAMI
MTKSSNGWLYILTAIDYFSKWAKGSSLKELKKENAANFIYTSITDHYGLSRYIITDKGNPFCNSLIDKLYQKLDFKQRNSSMYYATTNDFAKAFKKTLCKLLKKMVWPSQIEISMKELKKL